MANHCLSNDFKDALHWRQIIAISKIWMIVHHIMENMTIKCFVNIKLSNFLGFRGLVGGWLLQMGAGWRKAINRSLYSSSSPAHLPSSTSVANNSRSNIQHLTSRIQDSRSKIQDWGSKISSGWADPRWMRIWCREVSPALQKYSAHKRPLLPLAGQREAGGKAEQK